MGWEVSSLYCPLEAEESGIPFVQPWIVFWTGQNNKENKINCEEMDMEPLRFSSSNSNIYFY